MQVDVVGRLAELPARLRPRARAVEKTWPLSASDLQRVRITWPSRYRWPAGRGIFETQKDALSDLGVLAVGDVEQAFQGALRLECAVDGERHSVFLDMSDYPDAVNEEALEQSGIYFKGMFREQGYGDPRILPAGYTVTGRDYYRYYRPFRSRYNGRRTIDVLGRFGLKFQPELRQKAVDMLAAAKDLNFVGAGGKVRYSRFLREIAAARLSLHVAGNGPFTHRVTEFLGLGSCMISVRFPLALHVPLVPGVHYVTFADDLSDLVDVCRYYIQHEDERERIAAAGCEYFERYLHFDQLAGYYVTTILNRLGKR
jgi:glycosyl transferase family 1